MAELAAPNLHVYYDDLVTALATVGIDISGSSGVRDVRMDPKGITVVRMVRAESGKGWRAEDGRVLLVEDEYRMKYGRPACSCALVNYSTGPELTVPADLRPALDPACPLHGDQR